MTPDMQPGWREIVAWSVMLTLLALSFLALVYEMPASTRDLVDECRCDAGNAGVAQQAEQRVCNPTVGGSIPPIGPTH